MITTGTGGALWQGDSPPRQGWGIAPAVKNVTHRQRKEQHRLLHSGSCASCTYVHPVLILAHEV